MNYEVLPPEIFGHIFSYLQGWECGALRCVSHSFNEYLDNEDIWKSFLAAEFEYEHTLYTSGQYQNDFHPNWKSFKEFYKMVSLTAASLCTKCNVYTQLYTKRRCVDMALCHACQDCIKLPDVKEKYAIRPDELKRLYPTIFGMFAYDRCEIENFLAQNYLSDEVDFRKKVYATREKFKLRKKHNKQVEQRKNIEKDLMAQGLKPKHARFVSRQLRNFIHKETYDKQLEQEKKKNIVFKLFKSEYGQWPTPAQQILLVRETNIEGDRAPVYIRRDVQTVVSTVKRVVGLSVTSGPLTFDDKGDALWMSWFKFNKHLGEDQIVNRCKRLEKKLQRYGFNAQYALTRDTVGLRNYMSSGDGMHVIIRTLMTTNYHDHRLIDRLSLKERFVLLERLFNDIALLANSHLLEEIRGFLETKDKIHEYFQNPFVKKSLQRSIDDMWNAIYRNHKLKEIIDDVIWWDYARISPDQLLPVGRVEPVVLKGRQKLKREIQEIGETVADRVHKRTRVSNRFSDD